MELLMSIDVRGLKQYLLGFGVWAVLVSIGLMILQALIAPIPAFVITVVNGLVFRWFWGSVISLLSATLAAQICFEISKLLGRPMMERVIGKQVLETIDNFMNRYGVSAILVARLLPVVPFDPVSYAAGLTAMSRKRFLISNLIGQLPATVIYAYFGSKILDGLPWPVVLALIMLTLMVLLATSRSVPKPVLNENPTD
jgi:uncharacterized membrane protein YdjX (TVP38/TMEM64 family)